MTRTAPIVQKPGRRPRGEVPRGRFGGDALDYTEEPRRNGQTAMAHLFFAASIQRHIEMPQRDVAARSVDEALAAAFADEPRLRGYLLDDQGGLRRHLAVFVDGRPVRDRRRLSDPVGADSRIYVVQALSGG